jgi:hypothetical protein
MRWRSLQRLAAASQPGHGAAEWSDVSGEVGGHAGDKAETSRPSWRTLARVRARGVSQTSKRTVQAPFHGSAAMASDGTVRLGLFVHSTAESINDFTVSGVTDTDFVGTLKYDNDGDSVPNSTLEMQLMDCDTISIP